MRVVADGGAAACLNRCVLAALVAPPARARLLYIAKTAASKSIVLVLRNLQYSLPGLHQMRCESNALSKFASPAESKQPDAAKRQTLVKLGHAPAADA